MSKFTSARAARALAILALVALILPQVACGARKLATDKGRPGEPTVLLVLTNHSELGDTGRPTGFYLSEAAHPWSVFRDAGYTVVLTSPDGGRAPIDPKSLEDIDDESQAFLERFATEGEVRKTVRLGKGKAKKADAIFFVGGHGAMWDFPSDVGVRASAEKHYETGGILAAVCHGPAALVGLKGADDKPLVNNRRVTGFTNAEEASVEMTEHMPFLLETRLRELGAQFDGASNFQNNVEIDGRIITGQNPESARQTAEAVVRVLEENPQPSNRR